MRMDGRNTGVGGIDTHWDGGIHRARALVDARRCHDAAVVVPTFRSAVTLDGQGCQHRLFCEHGRATYPMFYGP